MRRVVNDLFHLTRVLSVVPDKALHSALVKKVESIPPPTSQLDVETLIKALTCAADLGIKSGAFVDACLSHARLQLNECDGRQLASLISISTTINPNLVGEAGGVVKAVAHSMTPTQLCSTATAFSRIGFKDGSSWFALANAAAKTMEQFTAPQVTQFTAAIAEVRLQDTNLLQSLERRVVNGLHMFRGDELSAIVRNMQKLGHDCTALVESISQSNNETNLDGIRIKGSDSQRLREAFIMRSVKEISDASSLAQIVEALQAAKKRKFVSPELVAASESRTVELVAADDTNKPTVTTLLELATLLMQLGAPRSSLVATLCTMIADHNDIPLEDAVKALRFGRHLRSHVNSTHPVYDTLRRLLDNPELDVESLKLRDFLLYMCVVGDVPNTKGSSWCPLLQQRIGTVPLPYCYQLCASLKRLGAEDAERTLSAVYHRIRTFEPSWRTKVAPQEVLMLVRSMGGAARDEELLLQACAFIQQSPALFSSEDIGILLLTAARLQIRDETFFETLSMKVLGSNAKVSTVCTILRVYATLQLLRKNVIGQCMSQLRVIGGDATPEDVTVAMYAFAKLDMHNYKGVATVLLDGAANKVESFTATQLASTMNSCRILEFPHPTFFGVALRQLLKIEMPMKKRVVSIGCIANLTPSVMTSQQREEVSFIVLPHLNELDGGGLLSFLSIALQVELRITNADLVALHKRGCELVQETLPATHTARLAGSLARIGYIFQDLQHDPICQAVAASSNELINNRTMRDELRYARILHLVDPSAAPRNEPELEIDAPSPTRNVKSSKKETTAAKKSRAKAKELSTKKKQSTKKTKKSKSK